ncbi:hypothetical protein M408DRAFT_30439 [Serendipita vermifera MAFF 305830]|uniref:Protein kinase domain-containing protein n=1 Tax=Serendipita vermifera MAFF 305830 TaxID=933852 RepID=A0A0C3A6R8_SERVB|nr:hypothetical protein M408DRAFT_30439 [Serendipita vermifera MAFF 305830]
MTETDGISEGILDLSGCVTLNSVEAIFNGSYSSVYCGKLGAELVAIKVLKQVPGSKFHTMEPKLRRERVVWAGLRHPNVLRLYGFANDHELFRPFGAFISPWCARGNASEFLQGQGKGITLGARMKIWRGVVDGVAYLHCHEPVLVHGDLKTVNILIDDYGNPQICDFGLISIYLEESNSWMTTTRPHTGTARYLAYELLRDSETVAPTTASDVFALGCIGLELPYGNRNDDLRVQIWADIKAGKPPAFRPNLHPNSNEARIWDILDRCWSRAPYNRPSAQYLLTWLDDSFRSDDRRGGLREEGYSSNMQLPTIGPTLAHVIRNPMAHQWELPLSYNDSARLGDANITFETGTGPNRRNTKNPPIPVRKVGHSVIAESSQSRQLSYVPPQAMANRSAETPLAGPSGLLRTSATPKRKLQGQRNEVDEEKLANAFLPGSHRPDPALRLLLHAIISSQFYQDDVLEPLFGTPEAEYLLAVVRARSPRDLRFTPRKTIGNGGEMPDGEKRHSQSIYMLFNEGNNCLICGKGADRAGRALGHFRSDIGHRPYHCHCDKCLQSPNPRRFYSEYLLDDHIKGQIVKQKCAVCHNLFRRGGMKRHMESKHKGISFDPADYEIEA